MLDFGDLTSNTLFGQSFENLASLMIDKDLRLDLVRFCFYANSSAW